MCSFTNNARLTIKAPIIPFLTFLFIIFHGEQGLILLHANHQIIGIHDLVRALFGI